MNTYANQNNYEAAATANTYHGMKWHKFLVNFSLWLGAILNFLIAFIYLRFLGANHPGSYLYSDTGLLLSGLLAAVAGVYGIVTRFKLARFKTHAPAHLMAYLALMLFCNIVIGITESALSAQTIIPSIACIIINYYYYAKRADLFVN